MTKTAGVIIITFTNGGIAEVAIDPSATTAHILDAMDLVRAMLAHGITAAKITRTTQTAKESPLPTVCDPAGGGQSP